MLDVGFERHTVARRKKKCFACQIEVGVSLQNVQKSIRWRNVGVEPLTLLNTDKYGFEVLIRVDFLSFDAIKRQ